MISNVNEIHLSQFKTRVKKLFYSERVDSWSNQVSYFWNGDESFSKPFGRF